MCSCLLDAIVFVGKRVDEKFDVGIRRTWQRLLAGHCGIVSVRDRGPRYEKLPCQAAALVPEGRREDAGWMAMDWLSKDVCAVFARYGVCEVLR